MNGQTTILITGAGTGFGRGAAIELARRGHRVIGATLTAEEAESLDAEGIDGLTGRKLDITDEADLAAAAELEIDVLVNNAGRGQLGPLANVPFEKIRQVFEVNVFGTLRMTRAVLPGMIERGRGRIVIVSSIAGVSSGPLSGPYAMTKHALEAMTSSLRAEMAPLGIEVCKLNPGPYATGFNDRMVDGAVELVAAEGPEADFLARSRTRILGNQLDPREIVDTIVHLCEAETVPWETFKPDDILDRFGIPPRPERH